MAKGSSPRKKGARLGQHFLTGRWAAAKLAEAVGIRAEETILEIGPGKGALTEELLKYGPVVAVEKDEVLAGELERTFERDIETGRLRIVRDDIRNVSLEILGLERYVLAANIPYYITGEILRMFLSARIQPRAMALLVQKEVAERAIARGGKESILSLSIRAYGSPSIAAKVARGNFSPPPSVDSAILLIEDISRERFSGISEELFFSVVRAGFASKRKLLAGNLAARFGPRARRILALVGIPDKARAEDVPLPSWLQLAKELAQ